MPSALAVDVCRSIAPTAFPWDNCHFSYIRLFLRFGARLDRSEAVVKVGVLGANENRHDRTFAALGFSIG
jgi:hypothetical protein